MVHHISVGVLAWAIFLGLPDPFAPSRAIAAPMASATGELQAARDFEQVRQFAKSGGERLWAGYGAAPFGLLLVLPTQEILLCQNEVPAGFVRSDTPEAGCDRSVRPRSKLPGNLLAAMGVFGPRETIVMGTPENADRTYPEWLRTILHEHFHQWQTSRPSYQDAVRALGLADNDTSMSWMLDFPVPYGDVALGDAFAQASRSLAAVVGAKDSKDFKAKLRNYLAARNAFSAAAGERNWRYIEFQLWQEGVARWTEIRLGRIYPDPEVRKAAAALEDETRAALASPDLKRQRRVFVYAYGAAEAMLIDRCNPSWREHYFETLSLKTSLETAARACGVAF